MIAIITRCRNRLEYTTRCVATVRNNTKYEDYQHIIIDNASSDGTSEWFSWLFHEARTWYSNLRYVRLDRNAGDWGGMIAGFTFFPKAEYYVQLDNDILVPENWLTEMKTVLDTTDYAVVMLKREGIKGKWILKPLSRGTWIADNSIEIYKVERPVACFMTTRKWMDLFVRSIPETKGAKSKYMIRTLTKGKIAKIHNLRCEEMEQEFQREK